MSCCRSNKDTIIVNGRRLRPVTTHKCDEMGAVILLQNGAQVNDTPANRFKYRDEIFGMSVACSLCGHALINDAWKL